MEKYNFVKDGEPVQAQDLNSILSSIYAPVVPVRDLSKEHRHYSKKNLNEDYYVFEAKNGSAVVRGNLSSGLLEKLKAHGIKQEN